MNTTFQEDIERMEKITKSLPDLKSGINEVEIFKAALYNALEVLKQEMEQLNQQWKAEKEATKGEPTCLREVNHRYYTECYPQAYSRYTRSLQEANDLYIKLTRKDG